MIWYVLVRLPRKELERLAIMGLAVVVYERSDIGFALRAKLGVVF